MLGRLQLVEENVHQCYNLKVQCVGFRSIYMYPKVFDIAISLKLSWFYLTKPQCSGKSKRNRRITTQSRFLTSSLAHFCREIHLKQSCNHTYRRLLVAESVFMKGFASLCSITSQPGPVN